MSSLSPAAAFLALLHAARQGSTDALGQLLENYRAYLLQIANEELPGELRGKVGGSDMVQQTFLEARTDFDRFLGADDGELRGWLRRILLNNLTNCAEHYRSQKRRVSNEVPLDRLEHMPGKADAPSANLRTREQVELLEQALARLPEEHRQVLWMRSRDHRSFPEIAQQLGRSIYAVRQAWAQAVEELQKHLESAS